MNIENLKSEWLKDNNKEFKYKEICNLLEEEEKSSGKSRNYQFEDWKRYFHFYKPNPRGQKFIIKEFYEEVKEKIDNRGKNENSHKHSTSSYEELEYILLDYINRCKDNIIYVTNNILTSQTITNNYYYFYMKNQKYFNIYMKRNQRLSNNTITKDLFSNINTSCKGIIQTSLKKLHKKYELQYDYNYILIEHVENIEGNIIDNTRQVTEDEIEIINITTKNYIEKFNKDNETEIKNLNDVCYLKEKLYNKFYSELNTEVFEELYKKFDIEIKMYFKGYIIKKLNNIDEILKDIDLQEIKENLNKKFIKNMTNNIKRQINRKKKIIDEYIDKKIEKVNILGIVSDDTVKEIGKNKFGYRDILMIEDRYKNEYIDILKFLLENTDITYELRKIKNEITMKYKEENSEV